MHTIWNIVGLKVGWLACVLGAAQGWGWLGPLVVAGLVCVHLYVVASHRIELKLILWAGVFGWGLDTVLAALGAFSFAVGWSVAWLSPMWMLALWWNFAMSLNFAMGWLQERYVLACVVGAVGGPLAYAGGDQFGALVLETPWSLYAVGIEWALALPGLVWFNKVLHKRHPIHVMDQEAV